MPEVRHEGATLRSVALASGVRSADLVVIVTAHKAIDYGKILAGARRILDCRNAFRGVKNAKITRL